MMAIPPLLDALLALALGGVFVAAFVAAGGLLLSWSGFDSMHSDPLQVASISAALGFAAFSYLGYAFLLVNKPRTVVIVLTLLFTVCVGRRHLMGLFKASHSAIAPLRLARDVRVWIFLLPSLLLIALIILHCLAPVYNVDSVSGYMFTARWLRDHGLQFSPYNSKYFVMPINTEIVYANALAVDGEIVPKIIDGLLSILFLLGVYGLSRRYADRTSSFASAASLAVFTPFIALVGVGKVDNLASFTAFSAVSLLFLGFGRFPYAVELSAFLMGTACAEKYTVWVFVPGFLAGIAFLCRRTEPRASTARALWRAVIVIGLCLIPHFVKDTAWTGNPVAPFARWLFPTDNVYLGHRSDKGPFAPWKWLVLPYSLFFDASYHRVRLPGPFPVLLLLGIPLAFVKAVRRRGAGGILFVASIQLLVWIALRRGEWLVDRFLLCPIALLLVASAPSIDWLRRQARAVAVLVSAGVLALICYHGLYLNRHTWSVVAIVTGQESRADWLFANAPWYPFSAIQRLVPHLGTDGRLFVEGEFYAVPDAALPFISTEHEISDFIKTADTVKVKYLRDGHFSYCILQGSAPQWAASLERVSGGSGFTVLKL